MKYVKDSIVNAPEMYIIHGCNAQGVMGSGVAKEIRAKWPGAYAEYRDEYDNNGLILGKAVIYHHLAKSWQYNKIIGNLITQEFYGRVKGKRYADPKAISDAVMDYIQLIAINSPAPIESMQIATSKIGCGLGGLSWENEMEQVFLLIEKHFGVQFVVYDTNLP